MSLTRSSQAILLAAILALVVVGWIVLGLVGVAVDAVWRPASLWLVQTLGPAGALAFGFVVFIVLPLYFGQRVQRRHDARQYAADRTIHVEKPVVTSTRKRVAQVCFCLFVAASIALIMWADPTARPW